MNTITAWLRTWPRWLLWLAGIIGMSLIIDYWQWSLALALVAGISYGVQRQRMARIARRAQVQGDIARLERELGIV